MGADLSRLSTEDLMALKSGDISKVSTEGLMALRPQKDYKAMSQPVPVDPTQDMTGFQKFNAGAGKAMYDIGSGIGGLVGMGESPEELRNRRELDKPLMSTGAGMAGNFAGAATTLAPLALIPGANTVGGAAALGGAVGMSAPAESTGERLGNAGMGALASGGVQAAATPTMWAGRKVRDLVDPWLPGGVTRAAGRGANTAAGPDQQAIIQQLRNPREFVPGSAPTAGQAAAPVGRAEFSGLQEIVKQRAPTDYERIAQTQNAARVNALRSVGQDKTALQNAITDRSELAGPLYQAARSGGNVVESAPIVSSIDDLLQRNPGNRELVTELRNVRSGLVDAEGLPRTNAEEVASVMDGIKTAIADEKNKFIKKQLVGLKDQIASSIPGYSGAQQVFKLKSEPVNQMQIGQYLEGKLTPALNDVGATASQRSSVYAQALRDAPQTIKKSTGQPIYSELSEALNPDQMRAVTGVGQDLGREATHQRLAQSGRQKAGEIAKELLPEMHPTGMFSPVLSVTRGIINRLEGKLEGKSLDELARLMKSGNTQELANVMERLQPAERSALVKLLQKAKNPALGAVAYEGAQQ